MRHGRFQIETELARSGIRLPSRFRVRISKVRLAEMLLREAFEYRLNRDMVLSRPCIYGVFSGPLGGFWPREEKCVGCMRCVQEYPHIARIDRNPKFERLGDSYWSAESVATVWNEAETGKIPVRGMGYKGPFSGDGFDGMWTDMSEIVRPTRDGKHGREFISTVVDIGRKPAYLRMDGGTVDELKVLQIPVPILFDDLPRPVLNESMLSGVLKATKYLNTFCVVSHFDMLATSKWEDYSDHMAPLLTSRDLEARRSMVEVSRIVEFVYDGTQSYRRIEDYNQSCVVALRIPFRKGVEEQVVKLVNDGVGVIHLCADYHGKEYESEGPRFVADAIRSVHSRLVEESVRDAVTLVASGGIILAEHVPKAIICGADLVAIDTSVLVALGAKFVGECRFPQECALTSPRIEPEWGRKRLVNLIATWHEQLIETLSAMGMRDIRRMRGEAGRSMLNKDLERIAFGEILGYAQP